MTLVELLTAMLLMMVILSATLLTFERFLAHAKQNEKTNDQQQVVRESMDRLVRQLRNLANPTTSSGTIAYADNYKLVFQTTDPSRQWVAYCLKRTDPANEVLIRQTGSPAGGAVPGTDNCPVDGAAGAWAKQINVVSNVVNDVNAGSPRPLFNYYSQSGPVATPVTGVANPSTITRVVVRLFVDLVPGKRPDELAISSGVTMRNQNQAPTSRFKATLTGSAFSMDGSASTDAEGRNLKYDWYTTTTTPPTGANDIPTNLGALPNCNQGTLPGPFTPPAPATKAFTCIGGGVILNKALTGLPLHVWLRVTDAGQLADLSDVVLGGCRTNAASSPARTNTECQEVTPTG